MKKTLRKPENWQDFESLCKKLWGEIWQTENIKKNGRLGQLQSGVDVVAFVKNEYRGIQCKGKDDYTNAKLSENEIDAEISKARSFQPPLRRFIFATTANKDARIEAYIRNANLQSVAQGLFEIELYCWEDIVDLIDENRHTSDWYLNLQKYKESPSISVAFMTNRKVAVIAP